MPKKLYKLSLLSILLLLMGSCSKQSNHNPVKIHPTTSELSVIFLLGDGMGMAQLTAAWHVNQYLNMETFPYSGLLLTHSADKFVTESASSNTAMTSGYKTNYGFLGLDKYANPQESIYEYLKKKNYKTGIITSSFLADATPAALFSHRENRYEFEAIAMDYYHKQADFAVGGGQDHFEKRTDGINLLDSIQKQGTQVFYSLSQMTQIEQTPALGMLYPGRPPYLSNGRSDYLYKATEKALQLLDKQSFFLLVEGAQIDVAGHDNSLSDQITETLEFDRTVGLALRYAETHENVLVIVVSDHECGGLTLLQGEGMDYEHNYARDEHSGAAVPIFAYGPGAENFSGLYDNSAVHEKLMRLLNQHFKN